VTVRSAGLFLALGSIFVGLTVLMALILGAGLRRARPEDTMRRRLSIYTLTGRGVRVASVEEQRHSTLSNGPLGDSAMARGALEMADRVVRRRGLDQSLGRRLEAAGLPVRTAEWVLLHTGIALGAALLLLLLTGGNPLGLLIGLVLGAVGPWLFVSLRRGRRESAFLAQLPDTLQMLAGSLKAGYSLPQALDTVVREGGPPMSAEFNRALIESRLGIPVEQALDGIASRLSSQDFSWVVMAIRIQSEVGGNLAELLTTVADTLRERERLRRQVQVLSAEGRLSGWILGALPVVFAGYLAVARPEYLAPLGSPFGLVLVVIAVVLLIVGAIWMSRVVTVRV
jgi:tight adherence protein B